MPQFTRTVMLTLVAAVVALGAAVAQPPKPKVDPKKDTKPKTSTNAGSSKKQGLGTIEVYQAKDGYRFRIKDTDGKTIAMPTRGLDSKEDVLNLLTMIKETLATVKPTEVKGDK